MNLKNLRWIPTVALLLAAAAWVALDGQPARTDLYRRVDNLGTTGWIVGTWGHFAIWWVAQRRIRRYRAARDEHADPFTAPSALPDGWEFQVEPQVRASGGDLDRKWATTVAGPDGTTVEPSWRMLPHWLLPESRATDGGFPTREHAEEAALREIALRQPVRLRVRVTPRR
jgi:hypothetical protein